MKKFFVSLLLCLFSSELYAGSATLSWTQNPQIYEPTCDAGGVNIAAGAKLVTGDVTYPPTFVATDVGRELVISGAGTGGANLVTKVATFISKTSVTTADPAIVTVINAGYALNASNDIAGYKVFQGVSSGVYGTPIDVGYVTTYTINNLVDGTYYFAVIAYDACGNKSGYSNEVSKIIGVVTPPPLLSFNFTISTGTTVAGYQNDYGAAFNTTAGFGWIGTAPDSRERGVNPDHRLDSFVSVAAGLVGIWDVVVPNGNYLVTLASGDPSYSTGPHRVDLEGIRVINDETTVINQFITVTDFLTTVADGKLTITIGGSSGYTLLNYVIIRSVVTSVQPAAPGHLVVK